MQISKVDLKKIFLSFFPGWFENDPKLKEFWEKNIQKQLELVLMAA